MSRWMMRKLRPLIFGIIFLPLIIRAGGTEPFSLSVHIYSIAYGTYIQEPFVDVIIRPAVDPGSSLFQGFTDRYGLLSLGLFAGLPQTFFAEVKRDRLDSVLQHALPLVRCSGVQVQARSTMYCSATYDYDRGTRECECDSW